MSQKENTGPSSQKDPSTVLDEKKTQLQVEGILNSPEFHATKTQREFFQFVVSETLAGRSNTIKAYTVATQVFGRKADFDPNLDPIVSIQANKLRRALERYYLVAGTWDPVRIDMPKGTYVPTFQVRTGGELSGIPCACEDTVKRFEGSWPTLAVRPFQNLTGNPELDYVTIGLATELTTEITRYQGIRVLMYGPKGEARRASDCTARFAIDGSIRRDSLGIKVAVQLIDLSTNIQIWSDMHQSELEAAQFIAFQEHVARVTAAKIGSEFGIIAKACSIESENVPPSDLKTYEAILRCDEFNKNFTPDTFFKAFEALELATAKDQKSGLSWSMRARLYAVNYSLELFDLETPLEKTVAFAQRGVKLEPTNQRVRFISAYVWLLKNNISEGLAEAERTTALNPNSLMLMDNLGYLLTLLGDWERGPAMIREAIKHNPFYNIIVHQALWLDWVRQKVYEQAYQETLKFNTPFLFWDPLIKAATFGLLERIDEGRLAAGDLLRLKPDFKRRGRVLIGHYIKFDDIAERIIDGLDKVGLSLK